MHFSFFPLTKIVIVEQLRVTFVESLKMFPRTGSIAGAVSQLDIIFDYCCVFFFGTKSKEILKRTISRAFVFVFQQFNHVTFGRWYKKKTKAEGNQANSFSKSHICFGLGVFDNREYLTGKSFDRQPFVLITGCFVYKFDWIVTRRGSNPRSRAFTFWLVSVVQVVEIFLNSWKKVSKKDHC